jgi:hypothetical protein
VDTAKVRCNNCMEVFEDDDYLKILEDDGEFFKGCPVCLTDEYLMDLEEDKDGN